MLIIVYKYNLMILMILFFSPILVFSVNSWLSIWINMELNLLMFIIFILMNNYNIYDSVMKYYFINSLSSSIFIIMINMNVFYYLNLFFLMMNIMMFLKLGVVPFHYWFVDIMKNINWVSCLMLSTWQKIIPLYLLMFFFDFYTVLIVIIFSGLMSLVMGMNQVCLKLIFSYSSINHLCWMLFVLMINYKMFFMYFFIYMIINFSLMLMMNYLNIIFISDLMKFQNNLIKYSILMNFFSLGGLPPFFGFLLKWYSIYMMVINLNLFFLLILIFYSLMYLYYYMHLMFMLMLNSFKSLKYYFKMTLNFYSFVILLGNLFSIFMLISVMVVY